MSRGVDDEEAGLVFLEEFYWEQFQVLRCLDALCKTLPIDNGSTQEHTRPTWGKRLCVSLS